MSWREALLSIMGAEAVLRAEKIQTLWGGYGQLLRVHLQGGKTPSLILKQIAPPPAPLPGTPAATAHARKLHSYTVERHWYRHWQVQAAENARTACFLGEIHSDAGLIFLLEDLNAAGFPRRIRRPNSTETQALLHWLAVFHAHYLGVKPEGLWETGTYWHLATRQHEWQNMPAGSLKEKAQAWDQALHSANFQTLVHGDAKLANFCFSATGDAVAAVDFQYCGGGPGIRDLAYLLSELLPNPLKDAEAHLACYFMYLQRALEQAGKGALFSELESEWQELYPVACLDFERFLAGWGS